ncbi:MAG: hypothetical protein EAZ47_08170 [Bacteroidetes bacterium]|nr:MAG: hypothetical protein EAY72_06270 [Bacteroidota bacterium]TAF92860.1 MAG: hypothetical protein EAZ47_08170 [Bacteroidota bacterium]
MVGNGESVFNCLTSSINDNKRLKTDNKSAKAKPVKGLMGKCKRRLDPSCGKDVLLNNFTFWIELKQ